MVKSETASPETDEPEPQIEVPPEVRFGVNANGFRIVEEAGNDCFLDFLVFSAQHNAAKVVSRVRVRRQFIEAIEATLKQYGVDTRYHEVAPIRGSVPS